MNQKPDVIVNGRAYDYKLYDSKDKPRVAKCECGGDCHRCLKKCKCETCCHMSRNK